MKSFSFLRVFSISLFLLLQVQPAWSGSGVVNPDGTIDITVNVRFAPTPDMIQEIRDQIVEGSHILWDASEGQMRFSDSNAGFIPTARSPPQSGGSSAGSRRKRNRRDPRAWLSSRTRTRSS